MIAELVACGVLAGAAGFLAGWVRGRQDFAADMEDDLEACVRKLRAAVPSCSECGALFVARCPQGHAPPKNGEVRDA